VQKPYIIRVSSTKGGVGKSAIAVNLAVSLQMYGYRTLIVDLDTINPSVGLYLGLANVSIGAEEAMKNQMDIRRIIVPHAATGLHVLPGILERRYTFPNKAQLDGFFQRLQGADYDFIVVDTQPGIPSAETSKYYDEALLITLPDEASCISAIKMLRQYGEERLKTSILVNRVANKSYELSIREIEDMCETKVTGYLPEDENVKVTIAEHIPLFLKNRNSPFSRHISTIGSIYTSRSGVLRTRPADTNSIISRIMFFIRGFFKRG